MRRKDLSGDCCRLLSIPQVVRVVMADINPSIKCITVIEMRPNLQLLEGRSLLIDRDLNICKYSRYINTKIIFQK